VKENLKIRLNGKEIKPIKGIKEMSELKGEKEVVEEEIQFVKGLANGEVIHWSLLE